ncbi:Sphingosine 1-phosphate receptor 4 [Varanus komodoensis]|uniref:sphingosine 1-phosphate receptor 4 n=1 Tax=Varanus komodoensis TaxID=61221 RepID=UPI001CF77ABB|nr:sphingosine 1-phosphate receptor 4 [Varanus komodoensis]XP_044309461.1 sphingosine 1-phosphate receptor 4 [Varanus komodoensis]KAF7237116.1 Sphingosine 1-phosphate receptor 4 [Varanus komodoensis]
MSNTEFQNFSTTWSPSTEFSITHEGPRHAQVHGQELCSQHHPGDSFNIILYHYNLTGRMNDRRPEENKMDALKMVVIAASCLIILENFVVLSAIIRKVRARRWVYSCLASITLSDLLAGIAYLINLCLSGSRTFQLSVNMWFLREGVLFVALAASTFSLLVTAIERYSAMVRPIAENERSKTIRLRGLILFCWGLAILISLLPLLGWNCLCEVSSCSTLLPLYSKKYILFSVAMFSIILVGVVSLYASIFIRVQQSAKQAFSRSSHQKSIRLLHMVLLILFAFLICWIPLFILLVMDIFWANKMGELHKMFGWFLTLAVINSFINPIIYSLRSTEVRRAVAELLCCCCIRAGWHGPKSCLAMGEVISSNSTGTESSLKLRESIRSVAGPSKRAREPLSSNSSMMSTFLSDHTSASHILD